MSRPDLKAGDSSTQMREPQCSTKQLSCSPRHEWRGFFKTRGQIGSFPKSGRARAKFFRGSSGTNPAGQVDFRTLSVKIYGLLVAAVAQLVERNLAKVEVESSRLFCRSRFFGAIAKRLCTGLQIRVGRFDSGSRLQIHDAAVAQLVERNLAKVEVESSRLFCRSRFAGKRMAKPCQP